MKQRLFQIGAHPINWVGEDVKEHGEHTPFEQILDDMQSLGLLGTERGRKYPQDAAVLRHELEKRGMCLVSQWKSVLFSDPSCRKEELESYRRHVQFLHGMGCQVISTCESGGSPQFDHRRAPGQKAVIRLNEAGWESLAEGLNAAGAIAQEYGMKLTYHHHGGTVVEQSEEIDRLMDMTNPERVSLLYDTGHAYFGGADPLAILRKHYDRIAYIHLKDVRKEVLSKAREEGADFIECIQRGVFTLPGTGDLDFRPIVGELMERGYNGWAMLEGEQDPEKHPPYEYAKQSLDYLNQIIAEKAGV